MKGILKKHNSVILPSGDDGVDIDNRILIAGLIIIALVAVAYFAPGIIPTGQITAIFAAPKSTSVSDLFSAIQATIGQKSHLVLDESEYVTLLLPGGNAIKFAKKSNLTDRDVEIVLNAAKTKIENANAYPVSKTNEFTFIPFEQLQATEDPYFAAQYPEGMYVMPLNVN